jgi:uncharacterized protein with HEPN domain
MSKRTLKLLLEDIIDSAKKVLSYTGGMTYEDFIKDPKTIDAVVRNFEIIGEAANKIPEDFKDNNSSVDWHRIRGFRNRIVHDYFGIDYNIIWNIKETILESLIDEITTISGRI